MSFYTFVWLGCVLIMALLSTMVESGPGRDWLVLAFGAVFVVFLALDMIHQIRTKKKRS